MVRIQIQLTERQAKADGISTAELIRRAISLLLGSTIMVDESEKRARALRVVGRFRSGRHDISQKHDAYFIAAESGKRLAKLGGSEKQIKPIKRRRSVEE